MIKIGDIKVERSPASGWQPIETAPKDGSWILLRGGKTNEDFYCVPKPHTDMERPVVAKWIEQGEDGDFFTCVASGWVIGFWDGMWFSVYENPAEWMGIPA